MTKKQENHAKKSKPLKKKRRKTKKIMRLLTFSGLQPSKPHNAL